MKSNQRIELTKRLLQEGLLRILDHKSLEKVSVTELCQESGINRATFYRHYSVPRDVLYDMQKMVAEEINRRFFQKEIDDASAYLSAFFTYLYERANWFRLFIRNCTEDDLLKIVSDALTRVSANTIPLALASGKDGTDLRLLISFIVGGGYYVLRQWLMEDIPQPPEKIAKLFLSYLDYSTSIYHKSSK
ncbi:MAG: TetR/AcrR family transcriptional regulator [Clostridiales bacterium]|nr:TetR/AcrR family transcriptional regulator [Clostridiales bacterium]